MQTTGNLVGIVVEFTAGVQHGHDDFSRRTTFAFVPIDRYTAAIVNHGNGFIGMDFDLDRVAVTGQGLVDGIIHHLEHHMVQAGTVIGIANVHSRAFANGIQTLENFNIIRRVG